MSGGAYDYKYRHLRDLSGDIWRTAEKSDRERIAFAVALEQFAEAARMIEWVDSGDCAPGDEVDPIMVAFRQVAEAYEELKADK